MRGPSAQKQKLQKEDRICHDETVNANQLNIGDVTEKIPKGFEV